MKTLNQEINEAIEKKFGTEKRKVTMWEHCLGGILINRPTDVIEFGGAIPNGRIWFMESRFVRGSVYQYNGKMYNKHALMDRLMKDGMSRVGADIHMRNLPELNRRFRVKTVLKNIVVRMKVAGRKIKVIFKNTTKAKVLALIKNRAAAVKMKIMLRYAEYMMNKGGVAHAV